LTFSYKNVCPDTVTYDWFQVQIQSPSGAALATVVGNTCSNTSVWSPVAFDMTAYAGQNVVLVMTNHDDNYAGDPTYTLVDDISLY
jgi:serine protease